MRLHLAVAIGAVACALGACSADPAPTSSPSPSATATSEVRATPVSGPEPDDLTCPGGLMVGTAGGLYPADDVPAGVPTREEAVADWLEGRGLGTSFRLYDDGTGAWILRADGTARARVEFWVHEGGTGFFVQGYDLCQADAPK